MRRPARCTRSTVSLRTAKTCPPGSFGGFRSDEAHVGRCDPQPHRHTRRQSQLGDLVGRDVDRHLRFGRANPHARRRLLESRDPREPLPLGDGRREAQRAGPGVGLRTRDPHRGRPEDGGRRRAVEPERMPRPPPGAPSRRAPTERPRTAPSTRLSPATAAVKRVAGDASTSRTGPDWVTRPSSTRSAAIASETASTASCVATIAVVRVAASWSCSSARTSPAVSVSSELSGSSRSIAAGDGRERASECDPLLLAAGQLPGATGAHAVEPDPPRAIRPPRARCASLVAPRTRSPNAMFACADRCGNSRGSCPSSTMPRRVGAVRTVAGARRRAAVAQAHVAPVERDESGEHAEQRRLARAARSHHRHDLAGGARSVGIEPEPRPLDHDVRSSDAPSPLRLRTPGAHEQQHRDRRDEQQQRERDGGALRDAGAVEGRVDRERHGLRHAGRVAREQRRRAELADRPGEAQDRRPR